MNRIWILQFLIAWTKIYLTKSNKNVKSAIIVTTDKVYLNEDKKINFDENSKLGGHDIYSSSKACCEIVTESFVKSFIDRDKCKIATVRAGNCFGGGDWTEDRIVKDALELPKTKYERTLDDEQFKVPVKVFSSKNSP